MVLVWIAMLATTQTMRLEPPRVQVAMQGSIVKMMLLNVLTVVLAHIRPHDLQNASSVQADPIVI
jgi:hypothetical protein